MTTIRTSCKRCGDVELTPNDVTLELTSSSETGTYLFDCPVCHEQQRRPANHRVVSVLLATGVIYEVVPDGSPITEDEIREFAQALDRDDWDHRLTPNQEG